MDQRTQMKNALIYHILIDRFAGFKKRRRQKTDETWIGGTLRGIERKLPYLKKLGVTALRLSSPFKSTAYHGYSITDLGRIDPHFGSTQDLKRLIRTAHTRGMSVFLDYIATHCSNQHPFFQDALHSPKSPYRTWFSFTDWPKRYAKFLNYYNDLPKWNLANPATRDYIIKSAVYWLRATQCDGFFLDHAIGAPDAFWKKLTFRIRKAKQNAVLIGEAWFAQDTNPRILPAITMTRAKELFRNRRHIHGGIQDAALREYVGIFDGCIDFTANRLFYEYFVKRAISKKTFGRRLAEHYQRFPDDFLLPLFLDSHDSNRFLFQVNNRVETLKAAASIQYRIPQPKLVYYGTEVGMTQKRLWGGDQGFVNARRKMIWNPEKQNQKLLRWYRELGTGAKTDNAS